MAKGWFRKKKGKLVYFWYNAIGMERSKTLGPATMSEDEGWVKVGELSLGQRVGRLDPVNAAFGEVLDHWLAYGKTKTGEDKDDSTKKTDERNARNYLSHWADHVAKDMQPLEIQRWLDKQSYGLRSKLRSMMSAVYRHGQKWGHIPRGEEHNPMKLVSAPCKSDFEAVELSGTEAAAVIHTHIRPVGEGANFRTPDMVYERPVRFLLQDCGCATAKRI